MRIIKLKNNKILENLQKKGKIVEKGRKLSSKIEKGAKKIIKREMKANNISTEIKDNKDFHSGSYEDLKAYFSQENQYAIEQIIKDELKDDLLELDKLEGFVNKYNGEVSRLVEKENIELGEFEELARIDLVDGRVEVQVIDKIEEYKKVLREKK